MTKTISDVGRLEIDTRPRTVVSNRMEHTLV